MKSKIIFTLSFLLLIFSLYALFKNEDNIKKTAIELNIQCQHLDISKNDCIIGFYDKDFNHIPNKENFYLYKDFKGKTKENKYIIQYFYNEFTKASDKIYMTNKEALSRNNIINELDTDENLVRFYHPNGQILYEIPVSHSKINGVFKTYYASGQLKIESSYKDGEQDGIFKTYYVSGQLKIESNYKDGEQDGIQKIYEESGSILLENIYQKGKKHGMERMYRENGKIMIETLHINGMRNGIDRDFYESGGVEKRNSIYK